MSIARDEEKENSFFKKEEKVRFNVEKRNRIVAFSLFLYRSLRTCSIASPYRRCATMARP